MANQATATAIKAHAPAQTTGRTAFTVEMTLDKLTKNAVRYSEVEVEGQAPRIGQLYVQKHAVPGQPQTIRVTVEAQ